MMSLAHERSGVLGLHPVFLDAMETGLYYLCCDWQISIVECKGCKHSNWLNLYFCVVDSDEDTSDKSADEDHQQHALEELTNLQFKFEVKEVCCFYCSLQNKVNPRWGWTQRKKGFISSMDGAMWAHQHVTVLKVTMYKNLFKLNCNKLIKVDIKR